ncbi:MAG: Bax inhibitor-1 family protein [Myxococcales bacterium]
MSSWLAQGGLSRYPTPSENIGGNTYMPLDPWQTSAAYDRAQTGEAAFIAKVYRWMAAGLAVTGLFALGVTESPGLQRVIFGNPVVFFGLIIGELVMVGFFTRVVRTATFGTAALMFLAYCALSGLTLSSIFFAYTRDSIASTFFITGGAFAAVSAFGTLTKRDLSGWAQFLFIGLVGIIIASVVNIFLHSDAVVFVTSCAGVLVFGGLAAYDAQRIKAFAAEGDDRLALHGALSLYIDFINHYLILLRFFGRRR